MPILVLMLLGGGVGYYVITHKAAASTPAGGIHANAINNLPDASGGSTTVNVNTTTKVIPHTVDISQLAAMHASYLGQ